METQTETWADRIPSNSTRDIIAAVAAEHGLTVEELMRKTHKRHIAQPRQQAMYEVRKAKPGMSYPALARLFGGKHHTTVIYGVREHAKRNGFPMPGNFTPNTPGYRKAKPIDPLKIDRIAEMWAAGTPAKQIADAMGYDDVTNVYRTVSVARKTGRLPKTERANAA